MFDDRGSALVEAALITPIFMLVLLGLIEVGGAFRDELTIANASIEGARQAANQGNSPHADWRILQSVKHGATAMPEVQLLKVVVFKAAGASAAVPAACRSGPVSASCNYYDADEIALDAEPASWTNCTGPSANYCPAGRSVRRGGIGPDYVGVYIEARHPWATGLFGSAITLSDTSATRLEPQTV